MAFVSHHQRGPIVVLMTFHQVVDVTHHGQVSDGELIFVAFPGQHAHFEDGDISLRPGLPLPIEEVARQAGTEQRHTIPHLQGSITPVFGQFPVGGDGLEGIDHIPGNHLGTAGLFHRFCGKEDGIADQQSVGPGQSRVFALIATGDHDACSNLHFAEDIATAPFLLDLIIFV